MVSARLGILLGIVAAAHLFMAVANGGECKDCKNCEGQHGRFELGFNLDYESDGTATVVECEFAVSGELPPVESVRPHDLSQSCGAELDTLDTSGIDAIRTGHPALRVGKECTVEFARGEHVREISGVVRKVSREWLVLETQVEREHRQEDVTPAMSKIPYVNRLFRNVGIGHSAEKQERWIPRDAILEVTTAGQVHDHSDSSTADVDEEDEETDRNGEVTCITVPALR